MNDNRLAERKQLAASAGEATNVVLLAGGQRPLGRRLNLLLLRESLWILAMSVQGAHFLAQRPIPAIGSVPDGHAACTDDHAP